jgi:hypothetical protein
LIDAAVSDAIARRSANYEALPELSTEDAENVTGGIGSIAIGRPIAIAGYKPRPPIIIKPIWPPITVGLIIPPHKFL